jgi:hypothetical protein
MKKVIALTLATLSFSSMAATQADLILKGIVAPLLDISIAQETVASNLDLSQLASSVKVGTLTEKTNYANGYKILARSVNGGKLVNASDVNSYVTYTLTYNGTGMALNNSATQIYTNNQRGTFTKELRISYSQPSNLSAGSYEDTVQFTISQN